MPFVDPRTPPDFRQWKNSAASNVCPVCLALNNMFFDASLRQQKLPPLHPRCVCSVPKVPPSVTVIHIRDAPSDWRTNANFTYIGRPSLFGNPFILDNSTERDAVIASYKGYFCDQLLQNPSFRAAVLGLKNQILVCYCKPQACHGDVIASWLSGVSVCF